MMFKGETRITIIGGGIAGLAAAIACARPGKAVTIYERAATFEEVGAGLQLGPNAVRALQTLDVWDAVEPITYAPPAILMRNAGGGHLIQEIPLGESFTKRFGQPYRVAHRADLHGALLQGVRTLPQVEIILGKEIEAKNLSGPVIAADGIHSQTRLCLFPRRMHNSPQT